MGSSPTAIWVVHHTHTDWGYTTHPSQIGQQHCRYIDEAVRLCKQHRDRPPESRYRWTCESSWVVDLYLKTRPRRACDEFLELAREGLIEVTAGPLAPTPINGPEVIRAGLEVARRLKTEYGLAMDTALFCDINGLNWPWCDELASAGVTRLAMAMNFFAGGGMPRYRAFDWISPRDQRVLAWHGQHYNMGAFWGLNHDEYAMDRVVPERLKELDEHNYQFDVLLLQVTQIPADNMGPHPGYIAYIEKYNRLAAERAWPRMRTATLAQWFEHLERRTLPRATCRGDWSDWWASVLTNSPRSVAASLEGSRRTRLIDRWIQSGKASGADVAELEGRLHALYRDQYLVNEHIFGSSGSAKAPYRSASLASEAFQLNLAYESLYSAHALLKDTLDRCHVNGPEEVVVFDPDLESHDPTWAKVANLEQAARGRPVDLWAVGAANPRAEEARVGEPHLLGLWVDQDQQDWEVRHGPSGRAVLRASDGFGRVVVESPSSGSRAAWFPIDFGPRIQWQCDSWPRDAGWDRHTLEATAVVVDPASEGRSITIHACGQEPVAAEATTVLSLGPCGTCVDVSYTIRLPATDQPLSVYLPFPLTLQPKTVRADVGGAWIEPIADQIPGSCLNWLTVPDGVYVEDDHLSVLWTGWDAPVVMFEEIRPSPPRNREPLRSAHLISWPLSTYWITNATSHVGGEYVFRYRLEAWCEPQPMDQLRRHIRRRRPLTTLQALARPRES